MRTALVVTLVASAVVAAGYLGMAEQIADGFKVLAFLFGGLILLGIAAGGVRVSRPRPASPRLVQRVRRHTA